LTTLKSKFAFLRMRVRRQWLSNGKNYAMSNANELVDMFLIYPIHMKWVRVISTSVVDLNSSPSNWLWWMKLLDVMWNWSLLPITFLISFPRVLRSMIGLKDFGESYDILLDLDIMIVVDFLKWLGQYPNLIQVLAMVMIFWRHIFSLITCLRYPHDSLLGPKADELLHLTIVLVNSSSKNGGHNKEQYWFNSFNTFSSTWQN